MLKVGVLGVFCCSFWEVLMATKRSVVKTVEGLVYLVAHRLARVELGRPALGGGGVD